MARFVKETAFSMPGPDNLSLLAVSICAELSLRPAEEVVLIGTTHRSVEESREFDEMPGALAVARCIDGGPWLISDPRQTPIHIHERPEPADAYGQTNVRRWHAALLRGVQQTDLCIGKLDNGTLLGAPTGVQKIVGLNSFVRVYKDLGLTPMDTAIPKD